jgi:hypothetical protein
MHDCNALDHHWLLHHQQSCNTAVLVTITPSVAVTGAFLRCRSQGTGAERAKAWESWWSEQRPSHFNAMLAQDRRKAAEEAQRTAQQEAQAQQTSSRAARGPAANEAAVRRHHCRP